MAKTGPVPRTVEQVMAILYAKSNPNLDTGCLVWTGRKLPSGYGLICFHGRQVYIHRFVFEQTYGWSPEVVRHTCDNPSCWNPDHLRGGSHADNVDDKVAKGRHCFGLKHYNSKTTEDMVREMRTSKLSASELAKIYPLTKGAIHAILTYSTWKHVV